jgi:hypothetical protein
MFVPSRHCLCVCLVLLAAAFCSARGDTHKWKIARFSDDAAAVYKAASDVTPPAGSDVLVLYEAATTRG